MKIACADPPHIGRTLRRGLTGAKPEAVCHWCFEMVTAWHSWQRKFTLPDDPMPDFPQPDSARRGRSLPRGSS